METPNTTVYCTSGIYSAPDRIVTGGLTHAVYSTHDRAVDVTIDVLANESMEFEEEEAYLIDDTPEDCTIIHTFDPEAKEWSEKKVNKMEDEELLEYSDYILVVYLYKTNID